MTTTLAVGPGRGMSAEEAEREHQLRANDIAKQLSHVHALARHLLYAGDDELFVSVRPGEGTWAVRVTYVGFLLEKSAETLAEALELVLVDLVSRVASRLEEGTALLTSFGA